MFLQVMPSIHSHPILDIKGYPANAELNPRAILKKMVTSWEKARKHHSLLWCWIASCGLGAFRRMLHY